MITIGTSFYGAMSILYIVVGNLTRNYNYLVIVRSLQGIGSSFLSPAVLAMIADLVPSSRRGEATGMLWAAQSLGTSVGPLLGGVSHAFFQGFTLPFVIAGLIAWQGTLLSATMLKETRQGDPATSMSLKTASSPRAVDSLSLSTIKILVSTALISGMGWFAYGLLESVVVVDATTQLGASTLEISLIFTIGSLVFLITQVPFGKLTDRIGRKPQLILGLLLMTSMIATFGLAKTLLQLLLLIGIESIGASLIPPAAGALLMDIAPRGKRGTIMGINTAIVSGVGTAGPILGGRLLDLYNSETAYLSCLILGIAVAVIAVKILPHKRMV